MCGISGFIDYKSNSNEEILKLMNDSMFHRGPDGSGEVLIKFEECTIGLAHRRLSIIDLTDTGKQPMAFENYIITFNGEIYNYKEIRKELEKLNHVFIGDSDTEVILHSFSQWGVSCVDKFIGMFAFVILDKEKREIFMFRDRAGVKPLFYYVDESLVLFSSELKAFHKHPGFKKEINLDSVATFVQYGNVPTPHCIFKNCSKLEPGHYLKIEFDTKKIDLVEYWNVYTYYNRPKLNISFDEAKTETKKILKSAFDYRMIADVPVGIFLSGGYDSTCLAAMLQHNNLNKLKTFTIAVPDIGLNEAPFAKQTADYLGTDHCEYSCTQKEAIELISQIPYYYDEPFGDQSVIPTMLVSKMARKEVTVALSADAGDEIFAGYNRYDYLMQHGKKIKRTPKLLRNMLVAGMNRISAENIPVLRNKYNFHNRYEKLKSLLSDPSPKNIMLSLSRQYSQEQLESLMKNKFENLKTEYTTEGLKEEFFTTLSYMMAIDYKTYLLDDILQKVDRATMASSLEGREPFVDNRIIEWAACLPDNFKYNNGEKKFILKSIVHDYVPKNLMDRPKMGFAIPIENWLLNDLKEKVDYYLQSSLIEKQNIFNVTYIEDLKRKFYSGRKELALKIWYLLMFQMWYEKWME